MSDSLTICMNTTGKAPSQYINVPFASVATFDGDLLYFGPTGIFVEGGATDAGTAISAWVDLPLHDFGKRSQKSIEAFDIGYEASGTLSLTLTGDEVAASARTFPLAPVKTGQVQQDHIQTLKKHLYGKARYWGVRVANTAGCDFSLDYLALAPVFYERKPRG